MKAATPSASSLSVTALKSIPSSASFGHDGVGLFVGALDGRSAVAVVGQSVQGLLRHGVHDERSDELVNVDAIGVSRVLGAGGSPQRTLLLGALGLEGGPTRIVGELVLEQFVSETSVGDGGLAFESLGLVGADLLELLVDGGIHTGNEEGGDGTDVVQIVAVGVSLGDALDEGVDDLLVALEREDQGDVDGDALGQGGGDCRQAFEGCRNLNHGVRTVDLLPELDSLLLGGFGLVSQTRIHLDGDAAVNEIGGFGDLTEDVGGVAHVGGGELADSGLNVNLAEFLKLGVVRADLAQGLLEDGRVGGDANDVLVLDELLQVAGLDTGAGTGPSSQIETPESEVR